MMSSSKTHSGNEEADLRKAWLETISAITAISSRNIAPCMPLIDVGNAIVRRKYMIPMRQVAIFFIQSILTEFYRKLSGQMASLSGFYSNVRRLLLSRPCLTRYNIQHKCALRYPTILKGGL